MRLWEGKIQEKWGLFDECYGDFSPTMSVRSISMSGASEFAGVGSSSSRKRGRGVSSIRAGMKIMNLDFILRAAFESWQRHSSKRSQEWENTIKTAVRLLDSLMLLTDFESEQAKLLQEELRVFYEVASQFYPPPRTFGNQSDWQLEQLLKAIAAARIYFWIRIYDGKNWLEGIDRMALGTRWAKEGKTGYQIALSASHATMLRQLTNKLNHGSRISQQELEDLKRECLHWFASLRIRFNHLLKDGSA
jgi:hypothetical protein